MPKSYSPEFRRRVVDLCRSGGRRPRNVAEEFDSLKRPSIAGSRRTTSTSANAQASVAASVWSCPRHGRGSENSKPVTGSL